jgi:hypothetical protein
MHGFDESTDGGSTGRPRFLLPGRATHGVVWTAQV